MPKKITFETQYENTLRLLLNHPDFNLNYSPVFIGLEGRLSDTQIFLWLRDLYDVEPLLISRHFFQTTDFPLPNEMSD